MIVEKRPVYTPLIPWDMYFCQLNYGGKDNLFVSVERTCVETVRAGVLDLETGLHVSGWRWGGYFDMFDWTCNEGYCETCHCAGTSMTK
jgi:hypothetical protein